MADEDDVFSRWSRRKRAVTEEALEDAPKPVLSEADVVVEEEEDESALLERLGLPDPDTLKPGDDFTAFMQVGVPQFLRKRALRVLWRSNPVLANLDGLNDYDDDFNSPELTQKVIATAYRVGRGFLTESPTSEESEDVAELEGSDVEAEAEPLDPPNEGTVVAFEGDSVAGPGDASDAPPKPQDDSEKSPHPRRMRFET